MGSEQDSKAMNLLGLIGHPLSHSFSQGYFTEKFSNLQLDNWEYRNFPIDDLAQLPELISLNENLVGLNVTIPYKKSVIEYLDELSEAAKTIGAVNTIQILRKQKEFKLIGHNTDAFGFRQSLKGFVKSHHERALILGNGGAAKAVNFVLQDLGIDTLTVSRSSGLKNSISYADLNEYVIKHHKLVVNSTPLGMHPNMNELPQIPYKFMSTEHLAFDLIYNPEETQFLHEAARFGAKTLNGLTMLHQQADKAWEIWSDERT